LEGETIAIILLGEVHCEFQTAATNQDKQPSKHKSYDRGSIKSRGWRWESAFNGLPGGPGHENLLRLLGEGGGRARRGVGRVLRRRL